MDRWMYEVNVKRIGSWSKQNHLKSVCMASNYHISVIFIVQTISVGKKTAIGHIIKRGDKNNSIGIRHFRIICMNIPTRTHTHTYTYTHDVRHCFHFSMCELIKWNTEFSLYAVWYLVWLARCDRPYKLIKIYLIYWLTATDPVDMWLNLSV